MNMRMMENKKEIPKIFHVIDFGYPPIEEYNNFFKDFSSLPKHSSWKNTDNKWNNEPEVQWKYQNDRDQIQIDTQKLINTDSVYYNQLVTTISKHRDMLINIDLINAENHSSKISEKIKRMYDGMNSLPYRNEHIANAIKELLYIELHFNDMVDKIAVEFGESENGVGYYSRAFIFENDYQLLLREDILEQINSEYLSKNANSGNINKNISEMAMYLGCDIGLISDFNKLIDLFAKRIIPFQIYLNRDPILFNPMKIKRFGRP
jgi:hypothetical protein